ncbi:hypothetical protein BHE74_00041838 [Ensete ventricosum]|nr:hypothetical protein BHE74_00041838 [Ensete ventricosum]
MFSGCSVSSLAAKFAFFPADPPAYGVKEDDGGRLVACGVPRDYSMDVLVLDTKHGNKIVNLGVNLMGCRGSQTEYGVHRQQPHIAFGRSLAKTSRCSKYFTGLYCQDLAWSAMPILLFALTFIKYVSHLTIFYY